MVKCHPDHPIDESEYDQDYIPQQIAPTDVPLPDDLDPVDPVDPVDSEELGDLVADAAAHNLLHDSVVVYPTLGQGANSPIVEHDEPPINNDEYEEPPIIEIIDHEEPPIIEIIDHEEPLIIEIIDHEKPPIIEIIDHEEPLIIEIIDHEEPPIIEIIEPEEHDELHYEEEAEEHNEPLYEEESEEEVYEEQSEEMLKESEEEVYEEQSEQIVKMFEPDEGNFDIDVVQDNLGDEADNNSTRSVNERGIHDELGHQHNLRPQNIGTTNFNEAKDNRHSGKSYFPPTQLIQQGFADRTKYIFELVMTQMTAKADIKLFGQAAVAALMQEFAQLEDLGVYEAVDSKLLTQKQQRGALRAINLNKTKKRWQA